MWMVAETVIHEFGHYFGLSEDEIEAIEEQDWRANEGPRRLNPLDRYCRDRPQRHAVPAARHDSPPQPRAAPPGPQTLRPAFPRGRMGGQAGRRGGAGPRPKRSSRSVPASAR